MKLRVPLEGLVAQKLSANHEGDHNVPRKIGLQNRKRPPFCVFPCLPYFLYSLFKYSHPSICRIQPIVKQIPRQTASSTRHYHRMQRDENALKTKPPQFIQSSKSMRCLCLRCPLLFYKFIHTSLLLGCSCHLGRLRSSWKLREKLAASPSGLIERQTLGVVLPEDVI